MLCPRDSTVFNSGYKLATTGITSDRCFKQFHDITITITYSQRQILDCRTSGPDKTDGERAIAVHLTCQMDNCHTAFHTNVFFLIVIGTFGTWVATVHTLQNPRSSLRIRTMIHLQNILILLREK